MRPMLYVRVPAKVIRQVISKHGDMARRSGHLPRLDEVAEDGYRWAAAAIPPSDSETGSSGEEADEENDIMGSPTSAAHVGAPPPPPPTLTPQPTTGALTPPPPLTESALSPITTIQEQLNSE